MKEVKMNIPSKLLILIAVVTVVIVIIKYKGIENYIQCPPMIPNKQLAYVSSHISPQTHSNIPSKIPKIIVQTNEHKNVPIDMLKSIESIVENNRDYTYVYYDNTDARNFLVHNYDHVVVEAYDKLIPGAFKADLFRYCFLYKIGGVYIDTGMIAISPLSTIISATDEFVSAEDNGTQGIYNAIMASVPGHPILKTAIVMCVYNITNNYYGNSPLDITGPGLLAKAFKKVTGATKIKPNTRYNNVNLVSFVKTDDCSRSGLITSRDKVCLKTKYTNYYVDMKWYNTNEHYSKLWKDSNVYQPS